MVFKNIYQILSSYSLVIANFILNKKFHNHLGTLIYIINFFRASIMILKSLYDDFVNIVYGKL